MRAADRNVRTHSQNQIQQIAASMKRFGVITPIVADDRNRIVCGHARLEAAMADAGRLASLIGTNPSISLSTKLCAVPKHTGHNENVGVVPLP
jgi:hypothetical protein